MAKIQIAITVYQFEISILFVLIDYLVHIDIGYTITTR